MEYTDKFSTVSELPATQARTRVNQTSATMRGVEYCIANEGVWCQVFSTSYLDNNKARVHSLVAYRCKKLIEWAGKRGVEIMVHKHDNRETKEQVIYAKVTIPIALLIITTEEK